MAGFFSADDASRAAAPHVCRAWLLRLDLPTGTLRLHSGAGHVSAGGEEWSGVTSPFSGRLLSIGSIEEPRVSSAATVRIELSGVDAAFLKSVHAARRDIEGAVAGVWWQLFDAETQATIGPMVPCFPLGRVTAPTLSRSGVGARTIGLTIESVFSARGFAPGGRWTPGDQRRRWPGDKGLDFIGVEVTEIRK